MCLFLLMPVVAYAEETPEKIITIETGAEKAMEAAGKTIKIDNVYAGDSQDLITKIEQMANDLYQAAVRLIVPITLVVVVIGAIFGIFLPLMRKVVLFAILGLIVVLWAPMIVNSVSAWASL